MKWVLSWKGSGSSIWTDIETSIIHQTNTKQIKYLAQWTNSKKVFPYNDHFNLNLIRTQETNFKPTLRKFALLKPIEMYSSTH